MAEEGKIADPRGTKTVTLTRQEQGPKESSDDKSESKALSNGIKERDASGAPGTAGSSGSEGGVVNSTSFNNSEQKETDASGSTLTRYFLPLSSPNFYP